MVKPPWFDTDHGPYSWDGVTVAVSGDISALRRLVEADPDLARGRNGRPELLHYAVREGQLEAVRFLLESGAEPGVAGTAVIGRSPQVVALLLDRGSDIHAVHGAGKGSRSGYAPQDLQPIDLALWGGPPNIRYPMWRMAWNCMVWWIKVRLGKRPKRQPSDVETARLLISRGHRPRLQENWARTSRWANPR